MMWDVLTVHNETESAQTSATSETSEPPSSSPLLVVRWAYYSSSSIRSLVKSVQESLELNPPGSGLSNFSAGVEEIRFFKQFLEQNAARLDPAFVKRHSVGLPKGWGISSVRPVTTETTQVKEVFVCAACGKEKATNVCSRCKETRYCSRECQTAHWKDGGHKAVCKKPEDEAKDPIVVDCSSDGLPQGFVSVNMSHTRSINSKSVGKSASQNEVAHKDDTMFVVKIQVNMTPLPYAVDSMGFMCYDQHRKLNLHINSRNCKEKHWSRLDATIRRSGIAGCQFKGYFKAYLSKGSLKILDHRQLPLQAW
jgi:hypothetical protein